MEVDHRFYVETRIDQGDVLSDSYIAVPWRWRRQLPIEGGGCRMHFLAEIPIESGALPKLGFFIGG